VIRSLYDKLWHAFLFVYAWLVVTNKRQPSFGVGADAGGTGIDGGFGGDCGGADGGGGGCH